MSPPPRWFRLPCLRFCRVLSMGSSHRRREQPSQPAMDWATVDILATVFLKLGNRRGHTERGVRVQVVASHRAAGARAMAPARDGERRRGTWRRPVRRLLRTLRQSVANASGRKETGKLVGTITQAFNFGGGDLLQVMIGSDEDTAIKLNSEHQDSTSSREVFNFGGGDLLQEWKDRKRLQRRMIAAKKVLSDMDQGHVLEGLLSGDKVKKTSFGEQIGRIDFQLFQHAVQCVSKQIESRLRISLANSSPSRKKAMKIPYKTLNCHDEKVEHVFSSELKKGLEILLKSKAAIVLVRHGSDSDAEFLTLLNSFIKLMKPIMWSWHRL